MIVKPDGVWANPQLTNDPNQGLAKKCHCTPIVERLITIVLAVRLPVTS